MLSRLLHTCRELFFPSSSFTHIFPASQADQQLLSELAQAAGSAMAPTKSQDYNGKTRALEEEQGLVSTRSSKRRTEDKLDGAAGRLAPKKRRILTEKQDIASVPETALAEDFNSLEGPNGNNDAHERIPLESNPTSAATPPPNFSQYTSEIAGKFRKEESTISKNADSTEKALEEETDSAHPEASTEQATQRQKNLKRVAKGTTKETVVNDDRLSKSVPDDVDVKSTLIMAPKRNHKRFASEELETSELHEQDVGNGQEALHGQLSEVSSSSEDEEPETVTATDGFGQARAAAIDAAKVSARYALIHDTLSMRRPSDFKQARSEQEAQA